jgi:hypothetical protein
MSLAPAFVSVFVALAIGFGAIVMLRASHRVPTQPAAASHRSVVQRVVARYAVFRRPQTAADLALKTRLLPAHTVRSLVRRVATIDGHKVYVALTLNHSRLTGWIITTEHHGAGEGDFEPFPLHGALPQGEQLGRQSIWFVPDSVTKAVFRDYGSHVVTRTPHDNIVSAPFDVSDGITVYAGSRQIAAVTVPVAEIRLVRRSASSAAGGQAFISKTTGEGLQIDILANGVRLKLGTHLDLWLYRDQARKRFLGASVAPPYWPHNRLIGTAQLPQNYRSYSEVLITSHSDSRTSLGKIWFEGNIPR